MSSKGFQVSSLDSYSRRARLAPALLVVLPVSLATIAWSSADALGATTFVAVILGSGAMILLAEVGRDHGVKLQDELFSEWGGSPSVSLLRHRDGLGNAQSRARYHRALAALVPGIRIPTEAEELERPYAADQIYESCVQFLRERTRDRSKFPVVFESNVSYGFRRNLLAMKPTGVLLALLGLGACAVAWARATGGSGQRTGVVMLSTAGNAMLLAFWLLRVNKAWVRSASDAYAERLLAACDTLSVSVGAKE